KVLAPGFYSRQNIKTPVKIAVFVLVATQLMNVLFVFVLDFKEFKHAGLALAIGLGACLNAGLLFYHLRKRGYYQPQTGWLMFVLKLAFAVTSMAAVVHYAAGADALWFDYGLVERLMRLVGLLFVGLGSYFSMLWLMGIRVKDFTRRTVI
ncbi:MAG TPA: lipid II flippase MurJ, partial [Methylophilaceae bacterium]|nr:lipid II flippase MurJ [Methylophilaceae bacterium]